MKAALPLALGALALLPASALADGFTTADLSAAASTGGTQATLRQALLDTSEDLRIAFATDPAKMLDRSGPEQAALLREALAMGDASGDIRARWFMAGAIATVYPGARTTAFYNPLARGSLIVRWDVRDGALVVAGARLAAAGPPDWLADWLAKPGSYLGNLVDDYRAAAPLGGDAPGEDAGFEADRWITGVALWLRDPAKAQAMASVRKRIASGRAARFGGGAIDQLPANARKTFGPVAGFARADGGRSLIFGSPLMPRLLIAADFDAAATPGLKHLTLINLGAVE